MARKSQCNLPNPSTGQMETHHFETELAQVVDMSSFMQGLNKNGSDSEKVCDLIGANRGYRKASTSYALGDVVYSNALAITKKLVCVKAGTSGSSALTISNTVEGALVTDGSVIWTVDSLADGLYDAAHQNGMYRGADLTAYWDSGYMSTNIQAGKFIGMHIGDFITKTVSTAATTYNNKSGTSVTQAAATYNNVKWLLGGFDVHLHCGDSETSAHHVLIIPASTLQRNVQMNPTDDTTGAYIGSDMWRVHMPIWATAIKNAFGSAHILAHRELLSSSISATADSSAGAGWAGSSNNWIWTNVEVNIPNETMVYGAKIFSSSGFDVGDFPRQLPIYALKCNHLDDRSWFWLRAVASASHFCNANYYGDAHCGSASASRGGGGIRPYSLLR